MDQFLSFNQRFAKIKSKRLQRAVHSITGGRADPDMFMADVPKTASQNFEAEEGLVDEEMDPEMVSGPEGRAGQDQAPSGIKKSTIPAVKRKRPANSSAGRRGRGGGRSGGRSAK